MTIGNRIPLSIPPKTALPFWGVRAELPPGWQVCDGTNGTPDLRTQFIRGAALDEDVLDTFSDSTARPNSQFNTSSDSHTHTVDPAAFNAVSGNNNVHHTHAVPAGTSGATNGTGSTTYKYSMSTSHSRDIDIYQRETQGTSSANKSVTVDDAATDSQYATSNSSHTHTTPGSTTGNNHVSHYHTTSINVPSTTSSSDSHNHYVASGGDSETAPKHILMYWITFIGTTA